MAQDEDSVREAAMARRVARAEDEIREGILGKFTSRLHPRDRAGKWRDSPGGGLESKYDMQGKRAAAAGPSKHDSMHDAPNGTFGNSAPSPHEERATHETGFEKVGDGLHVLQHKGQTGGKIDVGYVQKDAFGAFSARHLPSGHRSDHTTLDKAKAAVLGAHEKHVAHQAKMGDGSWATRHGSGGAKHPWGNEIEAARNAAAGDSHALHGWKGPDGKVMGGKPAARSEAQMKADDWAPLYPDHAQKAADRRIARNSGRHQAEPNMNAAMDASSEGKLDEHVQSLTDAQAAALAREAGQGDAGTRNHPSTHAVVKALERRRAAIARRQAGGK